jgi:hypothetical protein
MLSLVLASGDNIHGRDQQRFEHIPAHLNKKRLSHESLFPELFAVRELFELPRLDSNQRHAD